jgi:hypothetical protein
VSTTIEQKEDELRAALLTASSIAFDGCHKIYILLDEAQTDLMTSYGYGGGASHHLPVGDVGEALDTLTDWYQDSCDLRFIQSVRTVEGDPNDGFHSIINQFEQYDTGEEWHL